MTDHVKFGETLGDMAVEGGEKDRRDLQRKSESDWNETKVKSIETTPFRGRSGNRLGDL